MRSEVSFLKSINLSTRIFLCVCVFLTALVFMLALPSSAHAATSAEKQAEANAARSHLSDLMDQLEIASDNYYTALDQHDTAVNAMNDAQDRIEAAEAQIASLQGHLGVRARSMYKSGATSILDVLLGASSFTDFISTWDFLNEMNASDADCVAQTKVLEKEAQAARAEYAVQEKIAAQKLAEAEIAQSALQNSVDAYQHTVANLDAEVSALIAKEEAAEAAAAKAAAQAALADSNKYGASYDGNNEIVRLAYSRVGSKYTQAAGERNGPWSFDCSGLTQWCYAQVGISIPGTSSTQYSGMRHISLSQAQPGDVLWMEGHVAIYAGGNTYVHASDYGVGVIVSTGIGSFDCALRPY
jgi:peptidoglycan DL-endopeptidase CwlO